jgi:hypothetical protein
VKIFQNQRGALLLETVVVLGMTVLLIGGFTTSIYQGLKISRGNDTHTYAVNQISSAGYWICLDGQMAQVTSLIEGAPSDQLSLRWIDRYNAANIDHTCNYELVGQELKRTYTTASLSQTITVARQVNDISFRIEDRMLFADIVCHEETGEDVSKTYQVYLRATG